MLTKSAVLRVHRPLCEERDHRDTHPPLPTAHDTATVSTHTARLAAQLKAFAHPPTVAAISPLFPPPAARADCWACPGDHLLIRPFLGRHRHLHLGLPPQLRTRRSNRHRTRVAYQRGEKGGRLIIRAPSARQLRPRSPCTHPHHKSTRHPSYGGSNYHSVHSQYAILLSVYTQISITR